MRFDALSLLVPNVAFLADASWIVALGIYQTIDTIWRAENWWLIFGEKTMQIENKMASWYEIWRNNAWRRKLTYPTIYLLADSALCPVIYDVMCVFSPNDKIDWWFFTWTCSRNSSHSASRDRSACEPPTECSPWGFARNEAGTSWRDGDAEIWNFSGIVIFRSIWKFCKLIA